MLKKILVSVVLLLLLLLSSSHAFAVGSVAATNTRPTTKVVKYTLAWTATAGGAVSSNPVLIKGNLLQVEIIPSSGATQPTNLYGITLLDTFGADFLLGGGASLSNVTAKLLTFNPPLFVDNALDCVVAAAGTSTKGRLVLYLEVE